MHTEITSRDKNGKPLIVHTDDGFCEVSRSFKEGEDDWIDQQLDPEDFVAIKIGRETEGLVGVVNKQSREICRLKNELKLWRKAAGHGD